MQIGELVLERDQRMRGARDIARATRAGAVFGDSLRHRVEHDRALAHAEIVVRAPDHDVVGHRVAVVRGEREPTRVPRQLGEHPVTTLGLEAAQLVGKKPLVIHRPSSPGARQRRVHRYSYNTAAFRRYNL